MYDDILYAVDDPVAVITLTDDREAFTAKLDSEDPSCTQRQTRGVGRQARAWRGLMR
ncbi:MAG: hypothetical protein ACE363_02570 [Alphaproteobacteria bacterium]